jgi:protein-S-isoprenylcysteine O-methyltransferase Ste14
MKTARLLDIVERLVGAALYGWLVVRIVGSFSEHGNFTTLLILPSEALVLVFLLIRRTTDEVSRRPREWLLALAATSAPMLVAPGIGRALVSPIFAAALMVMGLVVQLHAKITLGRSFGCIPAHRGLQTSGPYRFLRHPMYSGYLLGHAAFLLVNPTARNAIAYGVCYALQIPRLMAEERLLTQDPAYARYTQHVRWRLLPGLF